MHRCLRIPEMLRMICIHLLDSSAQHTLAVFATLCKEFENHALDVLWSEITGVLPLISCLPSDLKRNLRKGRLPDRPVLSSDLTRLLKHSLRVTTYKRYPAVSTALLVESVLLQTLHLAIPQAYLFPNITTLEWVTGFDQLFEDWKWVPFFLGPKLQSILLHLARCSRPALGLSLLARLKSSCPLIQHASLTFQFDEPSASIDHRMQATSDALSGWSQLSTLTVNKLDADAWLQLSRSKTLQVLDIGNFHTFDANRLDIPGQTRPKGFSALRTFCVRAATIASCSQLTKSFDDSPLEAFVVGIIRPSATSWWRVLFTSLERGCAHSALKTIQIYKCDNYEMASVGAPVTASIIAPLFSFPNLTTIGIDAESSSKFFLLNDDLDRLNSWSRLHTLTFGPRTYCHQTPGLLGLVPFAEHCPNLQNLTIFVDATTHVPTSDDFFQIRTKGISNKSLTHLDVGNSPNNPSTMAISASLIAMIFPCLRSITAVHEDIWAEVLQLTPTLASVHAGYEKYITSISPTQVHR